MTERDASIPEQSLPKIVIDTSLNEAPYTINVEVVKLANLLRHAGMPNSDVGNQQIMFRKDSRGASRRRNLGYGESGGSFDIWTKEVEIYVEPYWGFYEKSRMIAQEIADRKRKPKKNQFDQILYTKKLPSYLQRAPKERGLKFAERLLLNGTRRELNSALAHEVKHLSDTRDSKWMRNYLIMHLTALGAVTASATLYLRNFIIPSFGSEYINIPVNLAIALVATRQFLLPFLDWVVLYDISPHERSARRFAKDVSNDVQWRSIIRIVPKEIPNPSETC